MILKKFGDNYVGAIAFGSLIGFTALTLENLSVAHAYFILNIIEII